MANPHPHTIFNPNPQRAGKYFPLKEIASLYNKEKHININIIDEELYRYSCCIIKYAYMRKPLKDILPIAKEIKRSGCPQVNYNVNVMIQGSMGDLEKLYSHLVALEHTQGSKGDVIDITPESTQEAPQQEIKGKGIGRHGDGKSVKYNAAGEDRSAVKDMGGGVKNSDS